MVGDRREAERVLAEMSRLGLQVGDAYLAYDRSSERSVMVIGISHLKSRHDVYMTVQKALSRADTSLTLDSVLVLSSADPEVRSLEAASQTNQRQSDRDGNTVEVMGRLLSGLLRLRLDGRAVENIVLDVLARLFPDTDLMSEKNMGIVRQGEGDGHGLHPLRTRPDAALYFERDAVLVEVASSSLPINSRQLTSFLGMLYVEDRLGDQGFSHSMVVIAAAGFARSAEEMAARLDTVELVAWQTEDFEQDLHRAVMQLKRRIRRA